MRLLHRTFRTPNKLMAWAAEAQAEVMAVQYPGTSCLDLAESTSIICDP